MEKILREPKPLVAKVLVGRVERQQEPKRRVAEVLVVRVEDTHSVAVVVVVGTIGIAAAAVLVVVHNCRNPAAAEDRFPLVVVAVVVVVHLAERWYNWPREEEARSSEEGSIRIPPMWVPRRNHRGLNNGTWPLSHPGNRDSLPMVPHPRIREEVQCPPIPSPRDHIFFAN